ncbi:putative bifunctional diguanylate cyclase/phosphodiesterase [Sphingomonas sp. PAMC 26621]|uniref:putative bifunctional diguanylate cyclase/phosphodiesterase n=1 Tax=Sphingomonas sp. PAMC 26621 TaxID=1112213 RepID=UPI0002880020|nr:EAL domain-containing protein [Sphingomonas sp. PAMC 26621]
MRIRVTPFRALRVAFAALWTDLSPSATESEGHRNTLRRQLRQLAQSWPFALLVALAAPLQVAWTGWQQARPGVMLVALACAAVLALFGTLLLLAIRRGITRRWSLHGKVRTAMALGAVGGAALLLLVFATVQLSPGPARLAGFVTAFGAMIVLVIALYPVRAATLGFGAGLLVTLGAQDGIGIGFGIGTVLLLALTSSTYRLALFERSAVAQRDLDHAQGRMATRLVAEFETHSSGWFWQTNSEGEVTYLTDKVARELDTPDAPAIGAPLSRLFRMDSALPETERTIAFHLSSRTAFSNYSVRPASRAKLERWWSMSGRPIFDEDGIFIGFVGSGSDLTERRRADAEITRLALFDGLTGLANRQRLRLALDQMLAQPASPQRMTSLFLLDLDRFKAVNDTLGHQMGDALLKQVAQRLQRGIGEAGLVGRLGGDEFQVIMPGQADREKLAELARRVIFDLSQPYSIEGSAISIGCSIGIAIAPQDGGDSETLIRNADLALYAAKGDGRGIHRFFRDELLVGAQSRKQLEDDLRQALVGNQFYLAYQPVVDTRSERIVGYEALLRWAHPTRGLVSPAEFVPVAEDCGLIETIGEWVLRTACTEAAGWPGDVRVAVNVSPIQFANPVLPSLVTSALAKSGIAPHRLELEITEGVFLDESAASEQMFKTLKGCGVRLALDDFGTGYSSLGYLKKAPFDKIKIDQSFVKGATIPGNRNAAIIRAIVSLADALGMETTAEGVENRDEITLIRDLGCSHIQGFVYGKPARAADVLQQLTIGGGMATATGYQITRNPRTAMLRSARIEAGAVSGEVRIRNISSTGAMIEGIEVDDGTTDLDVLIELLEDQMFPAKLRWAADGRAGLEFAETFNLERLAAPSVPQAARKAG